MASGSPLPSERTMILHPFPFRVLPTQSPLFLPKQTSHRQSLHSNPVGASGLTAATTFRWRCPRFLPVTIWQSDANKLGRTGTAKEGLSNEHRFAEPKECLQSKLYCSPEVGRRLGQPSSRETDPLLNSTACRLRLALSLAKLNPSWTPCYRYGIGVTLRSPFDLIYDTTITLVRTIPKVLKLPLT